MLPNAVRRALLRRLACASIALGAVLAPRAADAAPPKYDVKEVASEFIVAHDGEGHYVVLRPNATDKNKDNYFFYGDGKKFYRVQGAYRQRDKNYHFTFSDRRVGSGYIRRTGSGWKAICGERETPLTVLGERQTRAMVGKAQFYDYLHSRIPHLMARSELGVYYIVDSDYRGDRIVDHRLYIGRKGRLKKQVLTDVVRDSAGEVFATRAGALSFTRQLVGRETRPTGRGTKPIYAFDSAWITPNGDRQPLLTLSWKENMTLVFVELGLYDLFGNPCDDL